MEILTTVANVANIITIGVYGAMIAICVLCAELAKKHSSWRKEAEADRDKAREEAEEARKQQGIAESHRSAADALKTSALSELAEAQAKVEKLYSAGTELAQQVAWRRTKIMGGSEYRVYLELQTILGEADTKHLLFSQVACSAFLQPAPTPAKPSVAADAGHVLHRKHVDFLIVDWRGYPVAVVEYQGEDHYQGSAYDRDQAKRIACHRAGIAFIEVPAEGVQPAQRAAVLQSIGRAHRIAAE